jgi:hypothetical protein
MKFKIGQQVKWRGIEGIVVSFNEKKLRYKIAIGLSIIEIPEEQLID